MCHPIRSLLRHRPVLFTGISLLFLAVTASTHAAIWDPTPVPPKVDVSGHTGGYGTGVSIAVPGFRGLAPKLALSYGSSSGNGFVGVGWGVSGLGGIVRTGSEDGAPRWDETDRYRLNGQKLVPCEASQSPGCLAGGTHFTESENYQRITQNGNGSWTVTARAGTQFIYALVMGWGTPYDYRWGLSRVVDTLGNEVNYAYWCDPDDAGNALQCYPDTITYNGSAITFYWELRPDVITFATGHVLGTTRYRLKTVDVSVSGQRVRAYALSYATSDASTRSLLASVQLYGTDASVDGSGSVSGGTSLPATTYTYKGDASFASFSDSTQTPGFCKGIGAISGTGDFNGDGLSDVWCHRAYMTRAMIVKIVTQVGLSNGDGTFVMQPEFDDGCGGRNKLQAGDFNGDGLTDFLCQLVRPGFSANVRLANGDGTFMPSQNWATNWCELTNPWARFGTADVNGDGKLDVWCHNGWDHYTKATLPLTVGISNGTGFDQSVWQRNAWCWVVDATFLFGPDVNGDGKADAICQGSSSGFIDVMLSTGSGLAPSSFGTLTFWCDGGMYTGSRFGAGDFNGDGKTDLWCNRQGSDQSGLLIAYSTGQDWVNYGNVVPRFCQGAVTTATGDFNGDGRTDMYCKGNNAHLNTWNHVLLSNDDGSFAPSTVWNEGWCNTYLRPGNPNHEARQVGVGDFNGDGKSDLFCATRSEHAGDLSVSHAGTVKGRLDLVERASNGYGGTTAVTYVPSSNWENGPGYSLSPTVSSITTTDGRGWQATTSYEYAGGLIDRREGKSLGFRYTRVTRPKLANETAGPYSQTFFRQDLASAGSVERSDRYDGTGAVLSSTVKEYATAGNGKVEPYTTLLTGSWSHKYELGGDELRRYSTFEYDTYGNRILALNHGNYDATGDEKTSQNHYRPNASTYIVGKLAATETFAGLGVGGQRLNQTLNHFDGAGSWQQPPTVGLLTKTLAWLDTPSSYLGDCGTEACIEYDTYGNVIKTIDALGHASTTTYDSTYNQFPVTATNPLGHIVSSQWDPVCGAASETTDANGQTSTAQYDALCRPIRTDGPLGSFALKAYVNLGDPDAQYIETQSPGADGSGNLWIRSYFDGLGRTYQSVSKGASAGQEIVSGEVTFNARGSVATAAALRYVGEPQQVTTNIFDTRDRVVQAIAPDSATTHSIYNLFSTTVVDPDGHTTETRTSPNGLEQTLINYLGTTPVETVTSLNLRGNPISITDTVGNRWLFENDNLGRKLTANDPDTGLSMAAYDVLGRIVTMIDARGQETRFTYDALGRVTSKSSLTTTVTYTYDEARDGYFNTAQLTTMTDQSGKTTMNYDATGQAAASTRELDGQAYTTKTEYDAGGRPISTTYPDGDIITTSYDGRGLPYSTLSIIDETHYDARGHVIEQALTNGITTTLTYSQSRAWLTNINTVGGADTIQDLSYARSASGLITSVTSPTENESWTYTYDDLLRLTEANNVDNPDLSQRFKYDLTGNITFNSKVGTYTYPAPGSARPHAVLTAGLNSYTYDANGQMVSGGGKTIAWNAQGLPTAVNGTSFIYAGDGSRLKKIAAGKTTRYIGGDYEIAPDGTVTIYLGAAKKVVHGDKSELFWLHTNHLGSIQAVTDIEGKEVQRKTYAPFGDSLNTTTSHREAKGWIGERIDDETGLTYLNARYYDPVVARFISPDPIAFPGQGLNRYTYSYNNPINISDPSGLHGKTGEGSGDSSPSVRDHMAYCAGQPDPAACLDILVSQNIREKQGAREDFRWSLPGRGWTGWEGFDPRPGSGINMDSGPTVTPTQPNIGDFNPNPGTANNGAIGDDPEYGLSIQEMLEIAAQKPKLPDTRALGAAFMFHIKGNMSFAEAREMVAKNCIGGVGPGCGTANKILDALFGWIPPFKNHAYRHDVEGQLCWRFNACDGGGYNYVAGIGLGSQTNKYSGQFSGLTYQIGKSVFYDVPKGIIKGITWPFRNLFGN